MWKIWFLVYCLVEIFYYRLQLILFFLFCYFTVALVEKSETGSLNYSNVTNGGVSPMFKGGNNVDNFSSSTPKANGGPPLSNRYC